MAIMYSNAVGQNKCFMHKRSLIMWSGLIVHLYVWNLKPGDSTFKQYAIPLNYSIIIGKLKCIKYKCSMILWSLLIYYCWQAECVTCFTWRTKQSRLIFPLPFDLSNQSCIKFQDTMVSVINDSILIWQNKWNM